MRGRMRGRWASLDVQSVVGENVCNGREAVIGLCSRDVVDMAHLAEARRTMLCVSGRRLLSGSEACKCLVEGRRLNHSVIGELRGRRSSDGQARRRPFSSRCGRRPSLHAKECSILRPLGSFAVVRASRLGALLPRLDNLPLLIPHVETPLQLLPHARVVRLEAGRQTRQPHVLYRKARRIS